MKTVARRWPRGHLLLTKEGRRGPGYGVMLCARFPDITLRLLSLFRGASADGLAGVRVRGTAYKKPESISCPLEPQNVNYPQAKYPIGCSLITHSCRDVEP